MSTYYGKLQGSRGEATRCGGKTSGITAQAETWHTRITAAFTPDGRGYIGLASKYGSDFLAESFDADAVINHYDDPQIQAALNEVRDAFASLDASAMIAKQKAEASK